MCWDTLEIIFQKVKNSFDYTSDMDRLGLEDYWPAVDEILDTFKNYKEDCDGFALACRKLCREHEPPIHSRLVFCITETGEPHLVLEVDGWVFDNRQDHVMANVVLPYEWIIMSGYEKGDTWTYIK